MEKADSKKTISPIWNVVRTEWEHLGSRRKVFLLYVFFFIIAGIISLLNPLVIGLIFNSVQ